MVSDQKPAEIYFSFEPVVPKCYITKSEDITIFQKVCVE